MRKIEFFVHGNSERIAVKLGDPAIAIGFDGRELDRLGLGDRVGFSDSNGFAGEAGDFCGGDDRRGGETPLTVDNDANAETETILISDEGDFVSDVAATLGRKAITGVLTAVTADAKIGIRGTLFFRFGESDGAEFFEFGRRFGRRLRGFSKKVGGLEKRGSGEG